MTPTRQDLETALARARKKRQDIQARALRDVADLDKALTAAESAARKVKADILRCERQALTEALAADIEIKRLVRALSRTEQET